MSLQAKRYNERVKLVTNSVNTLALAFVISGAVFPIVRAGQTAAIGAKFTWVWIISGLILHLMGHLLLGLLKSEE